MRKARPEPVNSFLSLVSSFPLFSPFASLTFVRRSHVYPAAGTRQRSWVREVFSFGHSFPSHSLSSFVLHPFSLSSRQQERRGDRNGKGMGKRGMTGKRKAVNILEAFPCQLTSLSCQSIFPGHSIPFIPAAHS